MPTKLTIRRQTLYPKAFNVVCLSTTRLSPNEEMNCVDVQRVLERHAIDNDSFVALYAETTLTREDFETMFR